MDKENVVYIYTMEHDWAIKKNEILSFATTWMDLEGRHYAKWNKSDRKTITIWYHLYVGSKKTQQTSEYKKRSRLSDIENKLAVASGERRGRRGWHIGEFCEFWRLWISAFMITTIWWVIFEVPGVYSNLQFCQGIILIPAKFQVWRWFILFIVI